MATKKQQSLIEAESFSLFLKHSIRHEATAKEFKEYEHHAKQRLANSITKTERNIRIHGGLFKLLLAGSCFMFALMLILFTLFPSAREPFSTSIGLVSSHKEQSENLENTTPDQLERSAEQEIIAGKQEIKAEQARSDTKKLVLELEQLINSLDTQATPNQNDLEEYQELERLYFRLKN